MAREENQASVNLQPHVLVVDDDVRIRTLIARYLMARDFVVMLAGNSEEALALLQECAVDAAVLDIMMPGDTGLDLAKSLRDSGWDFPIIFLTALGDVRDRISGLEAGADDYLPKPFEPEELYLRLKSLLRRSSQVIDNKALLSIGDLVFNTGQCVLKNKVGHVVELTDSERELLLILAQNNGETLGRDVLAQHCGVTGARAIDVQITRLRRKIEADSKNPRFLQTIRGRGYVLRGRLLHKSDQGGV